MDEWVKKPFTKNKNKKQNSKKILFSFFSLLGISKRIKISNLVSKG